jgi:hypothetical protein
MVQHLIEGANGWIESLGRCGNSPATFNPHLRLLGVIKVGNVDGLVSNIIKYIFNLA